MKTRLQVDLEVFKKNGAHVETHAGLTAHPAVERMDPPGRRYPKALWLLCFWAMVHGGDQVEIGACFNLTEDEKDRCHEV